MREAACTLDWLLKSIVGHIWRETTIHTHIYTVNDIFRIKSFYITLYNVFIYELNCIKYAKYHMKIFSTIQHYISMCANYTWIFGSAESIGASTVLDFAWMDGNNCEINCRNTRKCITLEFDNTGHWYAFSFCKM